MKSTLPTFYFNSHAREGRDLLLSIVYIRLQHFNSHAREGRDLEVSNLLVDMLNFNSHAREGCDSGPIVFFFF